MKLKYYLRGTGVGIILTAIVFSFANPRQELSDEEIIRRAASLGMVMKDDEGTSLDKLIDEIKPSAPAEAATPAQSAAGTDSKVTEPAVTVTPDENTQPEDVDDANKNDEEDSLPQPDQNNDAGEDMPSEEEAQAEEISFTIERGMSSKTVARLLEEKGLIDDAGNFNDYIVAQGKAAVIRTGSYSLPKGSSYREIMNAISK